jgi:hypothetical protein
MTMATTIPSPRAGLRAFQTRGFGRLVLSEGKVWSRGSDVFWALLFPTVLIVGQAAIAPELREIASGDTWAGTPFLRHPGHQRHPARDARLAHRHYRDHHHARHLRRLP